MAWSALGMVDIAVLPIWLKFSRLRWFQSNSCHISVEYGSVWTWSQNNQFCWEHAILDRAGILGFPSYSNNNDDNEHNDNNKCVYIKIYTHIIHSAPVQRWCWPKWEWFLTSGVFSLYDLHQHWVSRTERILELPILARHRWSISTYFPFWSREYVILCHLWHWKSMEHLGSIILNTRKHINNTWGPI